jgi:hypothetical protein
MPISIAGSGTITGISAGGLPDAALAVTSAKIAPNTAGKVLQVVQATYSTQATNSTTTYADTGLTASITPSSASNKVLVIVQQSGLSKSNGNLLNSVDVKLLRGSTDLINFVIAGAYTQAATYNYVAGAGCTYFDSPSSTSSVTYKTQFRNGNASANAGVQASSAASTITLMEVAA